LSDHAIPYPFALEKCAKRVCAAQCIKEPPPARRMPAITFACVDQLYEVAPQLSQQKCRYHIMHEDTRAVHMPGMPQSWPAAGALYHSLTLPCGHTYHPTALALHFLFRDMRCPVCRAGHGSAMDLASVPESMREAFRCKLQATRPAAPPLALLCAVGVEDILRLLRQTVDVGSADRPDDLQRLATTRLYRVAPALTAGPNRYDTQRSFRRLVDTFLSTRIDRSDLCLCV